MTRDHIHEQRTLGETAADIVSARSGWWPSIVGYIGVTIAYLVINHWLWRFDSTLQYYTFLVSVLAIFLAQVILLSQNRASERDRRRDDTEAAEVSAMFHHVDELLTLNRQQLVHLCALLELGERQHRTILAILHTLTEGEN